MAALGTIRRVRSVPGSESTLPSCTYTPIADAGSMPLTVARGRIVEASFEGGASVACNGLSPPSCCCGIQEHVRVARSAAGVPRWQVGCVQSLGFRQHHVGDRCSRRHPPTAVRGGWSWWAKRTSLCLRGIRSYADEWGVLAVTRTAGRRTPKFHRSARTRASVALSVPR